jgi:hypothetical protein
MIDFHRRGKSYYIASFPGVELLWRENYYTLYNTGLPVVASYDISRDIADLF